MLRISLVLKVGALLVTISVVALAQLVDRTDRSREPDPSAANLSLERRGDIYMARKMYREAGETYKEAIRIEPDSAKLINKLGISYHQLLLLDNARQQYQRAWKIDKTYGQALNNLGTVYHAQGRYRQAVRTYRQALKTSPYSASIYSNLGTSQFVRGRYKDAASAYLKALELDPNVFEVRGNFGTILQERSVGNRGRYYYFMAKAYAGVEMWDQAILYLRKSLEEGFGGARKIAGDVAFEAMHDLPEFQRLAFPETIASVSEATENN